jgi:hypothetical protein
MAQSGSLNVLAIFKLTVAGNDLLFSVFANCPSA